jgi:DNA replication and repair protein RecF
LQQLIQYQKILQQRNALLKYFALNHVFENDTLSIYNDQLNQLGHFIYEKRKNFLLEFTPIFNQHHQEISGGEETVQLVYESQLHDKQLLQLLEEQLSKDRLLNFTSVGIHKDDLIITIQGQTFKQEASQGQRKSLLFAIRLAEWVFIKKEKDISPILLMDDIFEKLDENRMIQLLSWVQVHTDGQVFITDTHKDRVEDLLSKHVEDFQLIQL